MSTIVLCGSMKLADRMQAIADELGTLGHSTVVPNPDESTDYSVLSTDQLARFKNEKILEHFDHIRRGDAILVVNERLKDIDGYIGANAFLEMGAAFVLGKPIYLLNDIPKQPNSDEILGLLPIVIKGDLSLVV